MPDIVKALRSGRVLLMDGAMGTELQRAGVAAQDSQKRFWSAASRRRVSAIHRAYAEAGAEVFLTNSFQANALQQVWTVSLQILADGAFAAREIAGPDRFVLLDSGPFGGDRMQLRATCMLTVAKDDRCDGILLETSSSIDDTTYVIASRRRKKIDPERIPVLLSWTFRRAPDGLLTTIKGHSPERCAKMAVKHQVAALGVNCGRDIGSAEIVEIIRHYRLVTDLPLFARPNAGTPKQIAGQWVYPETPESMAAWLPALFEAGVVMVGGCCGTTPAHIAAFRNVVDEWNASHAP